MDAPILFPIVPRIPDAVLARLLLGRQYATLDEFEAAARARLGNPGTTVRPAGSR